MCIVKAAESAGGFAVVQCAEGGQVIATLAGPFGTRKEALREARAIARRHRHTAVRMSSRRRRSAD